MTGRTRVQDQIAIVFLSILLSGFFYQTIFLDGSISRIAVLAEWDSFFDAWRTGRAQAYDPSLIQIFLPDYVFLAKNISRGILPLWNPYSGLGYPFLADIQSSVFAPLRFVFNFFPGLRTYNFYLMLELLVCLLSCYKLSRLLRLNCLSSVFAALLYTFCPYNLWYLELNLGSSACLFPATAAAFVHAGHKRTLGSAILAGLVSGILILSGHPECSFFGIVLSSLFMFLILAFDSQDDFVRRMISGCKLLCIAAVSTLATAAPVLFPFAEYLLNAESYKYGQAYSTPVTWNGILFNLANPGQNGASPYLSVLAPALIPFALFCLRRQSRFRREAAACLALAVLTCLLVSQLGPLQELFSKPPLTAIITRYALPYLLMLFALLAAIGLQCLSELCLSSPGRSKVYDFVSRLFLPLALFVLPLVLLVFARQVSADATFMRLTDFDAMLPPTAFNPAAWRRDLLSVVVFGVVSVVCVILGTKYTSKGEGTFLRRSVPGLTIYFVAIACSFICLASLARHSLPQQAKFFYPATEITKMLHGNRNRSISTCEHLLRPASNAVYDINFLTVHNPLFPRRFLTFLKACGAATDVFNQKFGQKLSTLLNLASVRYILSFDEIEDAGGHTSDRFKLRYTSKNNIKLYENLDACPRAYFVSKAEYAINADEALRKIQSVDFEPHRSVVLEGSNTTIDFIPNLTYINKPGYHELDRIDISSPNAVRIACQIWNPGWLVLTDIYYPGWNVYVDGKKARLERANYAFRAVKLEPGNHLIVFAYEPGWFILGCTALCLFAFTWLAAAKSGAWNREL